MPIPTFARPNLQKKAILQNKCASTIFFGVEKSKFANRLKRVFPKFEADRSEVRGVNGRSKFDVRGVNASSKYISRKYPPPAPEIFLSANIFNLVKAVSNLLSHSHEANVDRFPKVDRFPWV